MKKKLRLIAIMAINGILIGTVLQTFFLSLAMASGLGAQTIESVRDVVIQGEYKNVSIEECFSVIEKNTNYLFNYDENDLNNTIRINFKSKNKSVSDFLVEISKMGNLKFRQVNNTINVQLLDVSDKNEATVEVIIQGITITGRVTSEEESDGLPGVNVVVKGTSIGTVTDIEGNFKLDVTDENSILVFSSVGYVEEEILVGTKTIIDLDLVTDITALQEIVVVGYGTKRKSDVTGAITSVSPEDFKAQPLFRVTDALQGRAAGVAVSNVNGAPGGGVKIRIRGTNSIRGNSSPLVVIDGILDMPLKSVNTNDIASIEILKDASSTSLYGARGANGVIIVTTKKGTSKTPSVNFDAFYGMQKISKKIDLLDGGQFAREVNKRRAVLGASDAFTPAEIADLEASGGTDWQDEIYRTAPIQNYQLSMSGKEGKIGYFISGNFADQEGILINSDYKRYTLRSNLDFDINKKLNVKFNLVASREEGGNNASMYGGNSPVSGALFFDPTSPVIDPLTGNPTVDSNFGSIGLSPVARMLGNENDEIVNELNANLRFRYEILDGLSYSFTGGSRLTSGTRSQFQEAWGTNSGIVSARVRSFEYLQNQHTSMLDYSKTIDAHRFSIKAIYEIQKFTFSESTAIGDDLITNTVGYDNLGLASNPLVLSGYNDRTIVSYVGRVDYTYKDRYMITGSIRRDGSSVFADGNKYGDFPAVALGWRLSEEYFMSNLDVFSNIKLRASYGITGNQGIGPYGSLPLLRTGINYPINGNSLYIGVAPGRAANPDLRWEKTAQTNFGIDLGFFEGRMNLTADYYNKITSDLLLNISVPRFTGQNTILKNVGEIENKGFEFALDGVIIDKAFKWNASFNIAFNNTRVLDLGGDEKTWPGGNYIAGLQIAPISVLEVGEELGNMQGLIYDGVYKTEDAVEAAEFGFVPGDSRFKDLNEDGIINNDDIGIMGNGQADYFWGFNNTFTFKGLELNIFWQAVQGFDVWNISRGYSFGGNAQARDATTVEILNQWSPTNNDSDISAYSVSSREVVQSSRWMEDGSFIRLNNISLGYYLPETLLEKTFIKGLKIYASAQNVWLISDYKGYDPEVNSGNNSNVDYSVDWGVYPSPRTFTFGINAQF